MLHHRLLIGFLNTSLDNTVQKTSKRHLTTSQSYNTLCFFILIMYILICGTNQKNALQNEIKDLTFEVSKIISEVEPNIWHPHRKEVKRSWNLSREVTDYIVFKQQKTTGNMIGHHNCMILNVKRVMLLASVPVLQRTVKQPSLLFRICTFQMKGNLKHF